MDEKEVSLRELSRRTLKAHNWGRSSSIHLFASGQLRPTDVAMENMAEALEIPPKYFAEYRLLTARRELDESEVGLTRALRNLEGPAHRSRRRSPPSRP